MFQYNFTVDDKYNIWLILFSNAESCNLHIVYLYGVFRKNPLIVKEITIHANEEKVPLTPCPQTFGLQ